MQQELDPSAPPPAHRDRPGRPPVVRGQTGFGGVVPATAAAHRGGALVAVLAVEHHAEGAALPVLVLSDVPGLLRWDVEAGLRVTDDEGGRYAVATLSRQSGLGFLQVTAWITPAVPATARGLVVEVDSVTRVSVPRGGAGVERPLAGGPWIAAVDLVPARTAVPAPPDPVAAAVPAAAPRVPARALGAHRGVIPVGQARLSPGGAVCLWALERYEDRSVLTGAVLRGPEAAGVGGEVEIWDDRGGRYRASLLHETSRDGWTEAALEVVPAVDPAARALGIRLTGLDPAGALDGPFTFGVALPPAA